MSAMMAYADTDSHASLDELELRLAAQKKINRVLVQRLEQSHLSSGSASSIAEQNLVLEVAVARKTRELEAERFELRKALDDLRAAQTMLLQGQKMESIGQLAAGMAHEINTPIQYVTDNVRFVLRSFDPVITVAEMCAGALEDLHNGTVATERIAECRAAVKRVKFDYIKQNVPAALQQSLEGLQRVASLVAAMKDFSHPSTSSKELIDIADVVTVATTVARNEWKYVATLDVEIEPCLPLVPCLRNELGQVILNLVVNAAHAIADVVHASCNGDKGKITISVKRSGPWAEIRVSDTGTGIPKEIQGRVFDPFFTTKPVGRGTGQGLAITYGYVVEKHGGQISFETQAGKGTTFLVRLPLDRDKPEMLPCA